MIWEEKEIRKKLIQLLLKLPNQMMKHQKDHVKVLEDRAKFLKNNKKKNLKMLMN